MPNSDFCLVTLQCKSRENEEFEIWDISVILHVFKPVEYNDWHIYITRNLKFSHY